MPGFLQELLKDIACHLSIAQKSFSKARYFVFRGNGGSYDNGLP